MFKRVVIMILVLAMLIPSIIFADDSVYYAVSSKDGRKELFQKEESILLFNGADTVTKYQLLEKKGSTLSSKKLDSYKVEEVKLNFLENSSYISWDESLSSYAVSVMKGKDVPAIKRAFSHVSAFAYDYDMAKQVTEKKISFFVPDNKVTLEKKSGICYEKSALLASMLRSQGIQTKLVKGDYKGVYHAWNEIFMYGEWTILDSTNNLFDANRDDYKTKIEY